MAIRALVAYSSKHGSTAEIAKRIGARLRAAGAQADVVEVGYDPEPGAHDASTVASATLTPVFAVLAVLELGALFFYLRSLRDRVA